jgi:ankyrin repeat protein
MSTPFRPARALPASPNLEQHKKQARELLQSFHSGEPTALERAREAHPRFAERRSAFALSDAQLVLAREHGFASWARLKACIESIVRPGPRHPYVSDFEWYEARARGLVEMHRGALPNALAQIRAWHPRFAHATDAELAAATFGLDDARLVYARQNGARDWEALRQRVGALASAERGAHSKDEVFAQAFAALEQRDLALLRRLLERKPGLVREQGTNGNTLLNLAVSIEKKLGPLVSALLEAGSDPNLPNDRGWTPLHQAAASDEPALVTRLLEAGAVTTISAHGDGGTPLAVALWWGRSTSAAVLAREGVVPDNLRIRAALDDVPALERFFLEDGSLAEGAGIGRGFYRPHSGFPAWTFTNDPREIVDEAFCWAARNGALAAMERLSARGANIQVAPCRGTPLMFAVAWRKPAAVRWLLEHGAEPNRLELFHGQERGRVSALHLAAQTDDPELVQLLLDHGADRRIKDENYSSDAAGWASYTDSQRTLALLLG